MVYISKTMAHLLYLIVQWLELHAVISEIPLSVPMGDAFIFGYADMQSIIHVAQTPEQVQSQSLHFLEVCTEPARQSFGWPTMRILNIRACCLISCNIASMLQK